VDKGIDRRAIDARGPPDPATLAKQASETASNSVSGRSTGPLNTTLTTPNSDLVWGLSLAPPADYSPHQRRWERSHRRLEMPRGTPIEPNRTLTQGSRPNLVAGRRTVPDAVAGARPGRTGVRASGEEVEAPPHCVASAPRVARTTPARRWARPSVARSTRGDGDALPVPTDRPWVPALGGEGGPRPEAKARAR